MPERGRRRVRLLRRGAAGASQVPLSFLAVHWLILLFMRPSENHLLTLTALSWALDTWVGVTVMRSFLLFGRLAVTIRHSGCSLSLSLLTCNPKIRIPTWQG